MSVGLHSAHALAAGLGSLVSMTLTYPLYTVTLRVQADRRPLGEVLAAIWRDGGPAGFFRGLRSALVAVSVQSGVYYFWLAWFKRRLRVTTQPLGNMLAGALAGVCTVLMTNPLWVLNTRQVTAAGQPKPGASSLAELLRAEGLSGAFAGVGPALMLVSAPAIQMWGFEAISRRLRHQRQPGPVRLGSSEAKAVAVLGNSELFVAGALAKILSTCATFPLQTVKTNMSKSARAGSRRYDGLVDCARCILAEEGAGGLYAGLSSKLLQTSLTAAVLSVARLRLLAVLLRLFGPGRLTYDKTSI